MATQHSSYLPTLILYSYHWDDLLSTFEQDTRLPLEARCNRAGRYFINIIRNGEIPEGVVTEQDLQIFITNWAISLDLLFFFRNLFRHIKIRFGDENELGGSFVSTLGFWSNERKELVLKKTLKPGDQWNRKRAISFIGTLFHKMMHAFFGIFLREDLLTISPSQGGCGWSGHGRPWANAMLTVGESLKKEVPFSMNVPIFYSVYNSMKSEYWKPTPDELRKWGASEAEVIWANRLEPWQRLVLAWLLGLFFLGFNIWFVNLEAIPSSIRLLVMFLEMVIFNLGAFFYDRRSKI